MSETVPLNIKCIHYLCECDFINADLSVMEIVLLSEKGQKLHFC